MTEQARKNSSLLAKDFETLSQLEDSYKQCANNLANNEAILQKWLAEEEVKLAQMKELQLLRKNSSMESMGTEVAEDEDLKEANSLDVFLSNQSRFLQRGFK